MAKRKLGIRRAAWIVLRAAFSAGAFSAGFLALRRAGFFAPGSVVDNPLGAMPIVLASVAAGGIAALPWIKRTRESAPARAIVALHALAAIALWPRALRCDWRPMPWRGASAAEAKPDMSAFAPFGEGSALAVLDAPPSLEIAEDLPVLDGATALYPVYAAFAQAVFSRDAYAEGAVLCSGTPAAYDALLSGGRDIVFMAAPSKKQLAAARASGADLRFTPIGLEAFVFVAGLDNPVTNLTQRQIRGIYSGKIARWATLGWRGGGGVIAFQRPDGSGSQSGLQKIMGSTPIIAPQPLPDKRLAGSDSLMRQVSVEYKGVQPALGYSYRYFASAMFANPRAKLLSVDGVPPTLENIADGSYPFTGHFYAATKGEARGAAKKFIDWILSEQGQSLIEKTGYVPIRR